jgi:hypothetical protein
LILSTSRLAKAPAEQVVSAVAVLAELAAAVLVEAARSSHFS